MTGTRTGEKLRNHTGKAKDSLLSCLSRVILEPDLLEPRYAVAAIHPGVIDSALISRALVRETLSFPEVPWEPHRSAPKSHPSSRPDPYVNQELRTRPAAST